MLVGVSKGTELFPQNKVLIYYLVSLQIAQTQIQISACEQHCGVTTQFVPLLFVRMIPGAFMLLVNRVIRISHVSAFKRTHVKHIKRRNYMCLITNI